MNPAEITAYLASNGHGILGTDLFTDDMPDMPDAIAVVYEYTGSLPTWTRDDNAPALEYPRIQLSVRGTSYTDVQARAFAIHATLLTVTDMMLGNVRIDHIWPIGSGWLKSRDDRNRWLWQRNYELNCDVSVTV